ncbi:MAG: helix-turn-helix transcriptional regulator [Lachnospiraceae bacterium]
MTLGEIIKDYRTMHDISMREFETLSGISRGYLSMLEKNENPRSGKPIAPSIEMIRQVASAVGMTFEQVFDLMDGQEVSLDAKSLHDNHSFPLTNLEKDVIKKFRTLNKGERSMFLGSLGIKDEKGDVEKMA